MASAPFTVDPRRGKRYFGARDRYAEAHLRPPPLSPRPRAPWWSRLSEEELLSVRLCDLDVRLEDSPLQARLAALRTELDAKEIGLRPHVWLSTHWFSPDEVPGFAVPFYLAHPRLSRLERKHMLEVEGGRPEACMRLMRHEAAHAIDHAYRIHQRKAWREHFGRASVPYRATYVPRPGSRRFVHNLENWYAQSHPLEDFAETFAVWLRPRSGWRKRYHGTPALKKLLYVDALMSELRGVPPRVRSRERTDSLPKLRDTLGDYYQEKQARYGRWDLSIYDSDLTRLFSDHPAYRGRRTAAAFLRTRQGELRRQVCEWTGQYPFVVDQVLDHMRKRSSELDLRLCYSDRETSEGAAILVTVQTIRYRRYHTEFAR